MAYLAYRGATHNFQSTKPKKSCDKELRREGKFYTAGDWHALAVKTGDATNDEKGIKSRNGHD